MVEGLRRSIQRGAVLMQGDDEHGGKGWHSVAMGGLWVLVLLFAGWVWAEAKDAREEMAQTIRVHAQQSAADRERIAILEESTRNMRESLQRIETGVNELRRGR